MDNTPNKSMMILAAAGMFPAIDITKCHVDGNDLYYNKELIFTYIDTQEIIEDDKITINHTLRYHKPVKSISVEFKFGE